MPLLVGNLRLRSREIPIVFLFKNFSEVMTHGIILILSALINNIKPGMLSLAFTFCISSILLYSLQQQPARMTQNALKVI